MNELESEAGLPATVNYRYADQVGDELFIAGQVPHDHNRVIVGDGDAAVQATQCLDNLRRLVELHRFELGDIRRLTVYVVGEQANLGTAWGAVTEWFGGEVPPATLLGVNLLGHAGQLVEIDATIRRSAAGADRV
ncbi:MAG: RidA family protein [Acidimicrobiales bacterium]